jgi:hypothetical protein
MFQELRCGRGERRFAGEQSNYEVEKVVSVLKTETVINKISVDKFK